MNDTRISSWLTDLLSEADRVNATYKPSLSAEYKGAVEYAPFTRWRTRCLVFLETVFGKEHAFTKAFESHCSNRDLDDFEAGFQLLEAARDDIEGGYLNTVESLIRGEIFENFLEMAEHLKDQGYKDPAAMLTGAVLENSLKAVARLRAIDVKASDDISTMNQKLAQANVYNAATRQDINKWNTVRNKADHGQFEEYEENDVASMISGIRTFVSQYGTSG